GLATPLSVIASVGSSARKGLLIKGGLYLEALAKVDCIVMDKTGTITFGKPYVTDILGDANEVLYLAASVEKHSEHPLASAIIKKAEDEGIKLAEPEGFEYLIGRGVIGVIEGKTVTLGNQRLFDERDISIPDEIKKNAGALEQEGKTILFLGADSFVKGIIAVSDILRDEAPKAIDELKKQGMRLILLTGDNERVAKGIANKLGIKEYKSNLLPEDKIGIIKKLQAEGHKVCMIGDGVNDAPALAQADAGIAMGVAGTDVAIEAAHVALMRDDWTLVPQALNVGRNTYKIIRQGIALGITWDVITMGLASIGILTPVMAAALEELPALAVAANASRLIINSKKAE
ncbi:MAG: cation-translocating P-type ATPase, partial [Deltaproteobacteria bacterium]|nr:cation-translocating P-type ATPase [Deltaproteobacteria bacterium]